jgi:protein-serine/threonine kinase
MAFAQNQQQQQQQQLYYQQQQQQAAYQQQQQQQQGSSMQGVQPTSNGNAAMSAPSARGPDYVVFERLPSQAFSRSGLEKATAAKLKLEHYYKKAVDDVVERNTRCACLCPHCLLPSS